MSEQEETKHWFVIKREWPHLPCLHRLPVDLECSRELYEQLYIGQIFDAYYDADPECEGKMVIIDFRVNREFPIMTIVFTPDEEGENE